ncbi:MAG TPA: integrin alpha [Actinomycetota bacterium]|nr:integrin alpha [Actinomycetota bacterium]
MTTRTVRLVGVLALALFTADQAGLHAGIAVRSLDLREYRGTRIVGAATVAAAGDVNGDGTPDVLTSRGDLAKRPSRGRVWVVFGSDALGAVVDVRDLGDQGFVIEGANDGDWASEIAPAGDVNGDGLDDVLVGAPGADNNDRYSSGTAYVVFGKPDTAPVLLAEFDNGTQDTLGFRIDGASARDLAGQDVAGLGGDVNGDGLDDLIVGAPFAGATYVIPGKTDSLPVDLLTHDFGGPLTGGFRIDTPSPTYSDAYSVAGAGDVNADGLPDVIVGVQAATGAKGSAFVVFATSSQRRIDVREQGAWGFRIRGHYGGSATGYATGSAGDLNRDGLGDVVVGAPALYFPLEGQTFVVYGTADNDPIRLDDLGKQGFVVNGAYPANASGMAVGGGADANGDDIPDLVVGAGYAGYRRRPEAGRAYVVYGSRRRADIQLRTLGDGGVLIGGARGAPATCPRDFTDCPGDRAGTSMAFVGDIDGDGLTEIAVGAPWAGRPSQRGVVYVISSAAVD